MGLTRKQAKEKRKFNRKNNKTTLLKVIARKEIIKHANPKPIGTNLPGFPKDRTVHLRYTNNNTLQLGTGSNEFYAYSCNQAREPSSLYTGQPSQWKLWSQLYNHYMVVYARVTATFLIPAATATASSTPMTFFIRLDDDYSLTGVGSATQFRTITEGGKTHWKTVMQGSNPTRHVIKGWFSPRSLFRIVDPMDCQTRVGGSINPPVDPPEQGYFLIGGITNDNSANGANGIDMTVTIDYYVKFSEPQDQTAIAPS